MTLKSRPDQFSRSALTRQIEERQIKASRIGTGRLPGALAAVRAHVPSGIVLAGVVLAGILSLAVSLPLRAAPGDVAATPLAA